MTTDPQTLLDVVPAAAATGATVAGGWLTKAHGLGSELGLHLAVDAGLVGTWLIEGSCSPRVLSGRADPFDITAQFGNGTAQSPGIVPVTGAGASLSQFVQGAPLNVNALRATFVIASGADGVRGARAYVQP
jgi:hypothetical protein